MDSLTQIVLGAAVGEVLLGKKLGWKAQFLGAIGGTIPDLDILVNLFTNDELIKLLAHRSYSHAWFMQIFMALPLAYLSSKIDKINYSFKNYFWFWYLAFVTHSLLDAFTAYGTQLFLPFSNKLVAFNIVSVVDIFYTLPFLLILIICLFYKKENPKRIKIAYISLVVSTLYLCFNGFIKFNIEGKFKDELVQENINFQKISSNPTLFTGFLWNGVVKAKDTIYCNEYSIFQEKKLEKFVAFSQNKHLSKGFEGVAFNTLTWFANDLYVLEKQDDKTLNFYILKWGRMDFRETKPEKAFRFYFKIVKENETTKLIPVQEKPNKSEMSDLLNIMWERIFNY
jgi:inner membrane protein